MTTSKNNSVKKIAIVTGASGNLGKAVVQKFLNEKYHVIGTVHHKSENGQSTNEAEELVLDLLNEEECKKAIENMVAKNKTIDVAILTAGGFAMGDISATSASDLYRQYQLNFETAYHIARPVFLQMIKQNSGRIFLIGSRAGLDTSHHGKNVTAYSLSKSLLFRLAKVMNAEAAKKNVVVSVIVPGIIDTPQNRESMPDADFSSWVPASRVADIIHFYSDKEAQDIREPVIKIYNRS
jgi:NAD(P)-dependent dehydrogenase (short-subunit alcohol dehydrogenase family)